MDSLPQKPLALINRGIVAYRADNKEEARNLFAQAVIADPANEMAWLWFAEASEDQSERRYCLDRAVRINPDSAGRAARERMLRVTPKLPQALIDVETPPLPPGFASARPSRWVSPCRLVSSAQRPRKMTPPQRRCPRSANCSSIPVGDSSSGSEASLA